MKISIYIQARNVSDGMIYDYDGHSVILNYPRADAWGLYKDAWGL